jgi:hypothetical protein
MIEEHEGGKSSVELAPEMLRETGYINSETMLNCSSSGGKKISTRHYKQQQRKQRSPKETRRQHQNFHHKFTKRFPR